MKTQEQERATQEAQAQFESIKEMVDNIKEAEANDNEEEREEAIERIMEDPLSVEIKNTYEILLSWGGPASRIIGELDDGYPTTAELQFQDWFTSWQKYECDEEVLLQYANNFYFGE